MSPVSWPGFNKDPAKKPLIRIEKPDIFPGALNQPPPPSSSSVFLLKILAVLSCLFSALSLGLAAMAYFLSDAVK